VQWRQVGQRLQAADHPGVHEHGRRELGPSVDDAVAHGVDGAVARHDFFEGGLVHLAPGGRQDLRTYELVPLVEHGQLEAARPGVDDK
jgi:hypothetical protein